MASALKKNHNYSLLSAVIGSLNISPVSRLEQIWKKIDAALIKEFNEMNNVVKCDKNYLLYREEILHLDGYVPRMDVVLYDLNHMAQRKGCNKGNLYLSSSQMLRSIKQECRYQQILLQETVDSVSTLGGQLVEEMRRVVGNKTVDEMDDELWNLSKKITPSKNPML